MKEKSTISIEKSTTELVKKVKRKMSYNLDEDLTTDDTILMLCNDYLTAEICPACDGSGVDGDREPCSYCQGEPDGGEEEGDGGQQELPENEENEENEGDE